METCPLSNAEALDLEKEIQKLKTPRGGGVGREGLR